MTKDVEALIDKVAAVVELFNDNGRLVRLDPTGELVPVNFAAFRALIDQHVAAVRLVNRGTPDKPSWERAYASYAFLPKPKFHPTWQTPHPPAWNGCAGGVLLGPGRSVWNGSSG